MAQDQGPGDAAEKIFVVSEVEQKFFKNNSSYNYLFVCILEFLLNLSRCFCNY